MIQGTLHVLKKFLSCVLRVCSYTIKSGTIVTQSCLFFLSFCLFWPIFSFLPSPYIPKPTVCYKTHSKPQKEIYLLTSSRREVYLPFSLFPVSENCLSLTSFIILLVFQYFVQIKTCPKSALDLWIFHQHYCNWMRNEPDSALFLKDLTRQRNFPADFSLLGILVYTSL